MHIATKSMYILTCAAELCSNNALFRSRIRVAIGKYSYSIAKKCHNVLLYYNAIIVVLAAH